jgi:hypothetical protein
MLDGVHALDTRWTVTTMSGLKISHESREGGGRRTFGFESANTLEHTTLPQMRSSSLAVRERAPLPRVPVAARRFLLRLSESPHTIGGPDDDV